MSMNSIREPTSQLFSKEFKVEAFRNKADAFKQFATKLKKRDVCTQASSHQKSAQQRFETDSEQFLPKQSAIRSTNKNTELAIKKYRAEYKRNAVRNFLPYLRSRLPLVKGRSKSRVKGTIVILEYQQTQMNIIDLITPEKTQFNIAVPPVYIKLSPPLTVKMGTGTSTASKMLRASQVLIMNQSFVPNLVSNLVVDLVIQKDDWEKDVNLIAWKSSDRRYEL